MTSLLPSTHSRVLVSSQEKMMCKNRILKELNELHEMKVADGSAIPNMLIVVDPNDHLQWYVLIHSLAETHYEQGEYLLHVSLSPRYPFSPPDFIALTPNGRFKTNTKLCFSNSSHHAEQWSPIWRIRTILMGFLSLFLDRSSVGLGHLRDTPLEEMSRLAASSKQYNESYHAAVISLLRSDGI